MKKYFILILIISTCLPSCKKGDDDPIFSVRSRTGRLSGEWILQSANWQNNDTIHEFIDGFLIKKIESETIDSVVYAMKMNYLKDGSYTINEESKFKQSHFYAGSPEFTLFVEEKGKWAFTGGYGETKKGEFLLNIMETKTESFSNQGSNLGVINISKPTNAFLYRIRELRIDKLVLEYNEETQQPEGLSSKSASLQFKKL